MHFLGIVGSLRVGSYNKMLMRVAQGMVPAEHAFELADIGTLPLFNADFEVPEKFPAEANALKEKVRAADGIIIATPEYNRSIPGVLKNAIDWVSRPSVDNVWSGKKILVMSASNGNLSAALAQYDLRRILSHLGAELQGQPEVMVGQMKSKFSEAGELTDEKTREFVGKAVSGFIAFVSRGSV